MQHSVNPSATAGMLDHLKVDAYGDKLSLRSMASVTVRESQLLAVSAFDAQVRRVLLDIQLAVPRMALCAASVTTMGEPRLQTLPAIAKAIRESALQLNPRVEGQEVLVPVPRWRPPSGPQVVPQRASLGCGMLPSAVTLSLAPAGQMQTLSRQWQRP